MKTIIRTYNFNSHKVHNPDCDILEMKIDGNTMITYGVYVKPSFHHSRNMNIEVGIEFMEYYCGINYVPGSFCKSYSRHYYVNDIPKKYKELWLEAKNHYEQTLKGKF